MICFDTDSMTWCEGKCNLKQDILSLTSLNTWLWLFCVRSCGRLTIRRRSVMCCLLSRVGVYQQWAKQQVCWFDKANRDHAHENFGAILISFLWPLWVKCYRERHSSQQGIMTEILLHCRFSHYSNIVYCLYWMTLQNCRATFTPSLYLTKRSHTPQKKNAQLALPSPDLTSCVDRTTGKLDGLNTKAMMLCAPVA